MHIQRAIVNTLAVYPTTPHHQVIDNRLDTGSYFVLTEQLFPTSSIPEITTGSLRGSIRSYEFANDVWESTDIGFLVGAVHAVALDVDDDGYVDLVVAHGFDTGEEGRVGCPMNCSTADGSIGV
jgi:hypothetical protein